MIGGDGAVVPKVSKMSDCSLEKAFWATASAARSRETVMVRMEPGPRGGLPGEGDGKSSEGNSRRWALGPRRIACWADKEESVRGIGIRPQDY